MTMLTAVALLFAISFGLALAVFAYFFTRFMGVNDTVDFALTMREINEAEAGASAAMTRAKAAGAA